MKFLAGLILLQVSNVVSNDPLLRIQSGNWVERHYNTGNGLSVNAVTDLLQDEKGFIWISTFDGLLRFDGKTFTTYDSRGFPEIPGNRFVMMVDDGAGFVFTLTERNQAIRVEADRVMTFPEFKDTKIFDIRRKMRGAMLMATSAGVYEWSASEGLKQISKIPSRRAFSDRYGRLFVWALSNNILVLNANGREDWLGYEAPTNIRSSFAGEDSLETFFSIGKFVIECSLSAPVLHTPFPSGKIVNGMLRLPGGWFELKMNDGFRYRWKPGVVPQKIAEPGLSGTGPDVMLTGGAMLRVNATALILDGKEIWNRNAVIQRVIEDREENLWIATAEKGLFMIFKNKVQHVGNREGLKNENVYSIAIDRAGRFWIPSFQGGLQYLDRYGFHDVKVSAGGISEISPLTSAFAASSGSLFFGTHGQGLLKVDGQVQTQLFMQGKAPEIQGMFEFPDGRFWVGTAAGIFESKTGNRPMTFSPVKNSPEVLIRVFCQLSDGSVLMAGDPSGIWHFQHGEIQKIDLDFQFTGAIREIVEDSAATGSVGNPVFWVGTEAQGLFRVILSGIKPELVQISAPDGLPDDTIHRIFPDGNGHFWIGTNKGILRISSEDLHAYADGKKSSLRMLVINENTGMRNREVNSGGTNAGAMDFLGRFWFPTQAGFAVIDPAINWDPVVQPQLSILSIFSRKRILSGQSFAVLDQDEGSFSVTWSAPWFSDSGMLRFRHRLAGFSNSWTYTDAGKFEFVNVPGGTYQFEVQMVSGKGTLISKPLVTGIKIRKKFTETAVFKILIFLSLAGIFFGAYRELRSRNRRIQLDLERQVASRTRDLERQKDVTQAQADRLRKLDSARIHFLSSISHEMKTPLTLIVGPVKLLLENRDQIHPDQLSQLLLIERNSDRLTMLLENLLDITQVEGGSIQLDYAPVALHQLLLQAGQKFQQASDRELVVRYELSADEILFTGDARRMRFVFDHVLSLLIRFRSEKSTFTIQTSTVNQGCNIRFHDSGPGIPDVEFEHVFEIFFQLKDLTGTKVLDSGIGLAFSRQIVQLHNGTMQANRLGDGTKEIVISLPTGEIQERSDVPISENVQEPGRDQSLADDARKILIVDDNDQIRKFVRLIFAKEYQIIEAENGRAGLEKAQAEMPDLILADVMMPELDGVAMVRELRRDLMLAGTPVVMLTAKDTVEDTVEGLEAGADVYLTKPFNAEVLKSQVSALLKTREALKSSQPKVGIAPDSKKQMHPFTAKVMELIAEHYQDPDFSVEKLAEKLFMDRTQLFRKLKLAGEASASKMIQDYRMNRAKELIASKAGNISEVAYACGYNSLSNFGHAFKLQYGISPREWSEKQEGS